METTGEDIVPTAGVEKYENMLTYFRIEGADFGVRPSAGAGSVAWSTNNNQEYWASVVSLKPQ